MAKKQNKSSNRGSGGSGGSGGNEQNKDRKRKTKPLSMEEAMKIIEREAEEEAARILAQLTLDLRNQGHSADPTTVKKILKERYQIDFSKEKIQRAGIDFSIDKINNYLIKDKKI